MMKNLFKRVSFIFMLIIIFNSLVSCDKREILYRDNKYEVVHTVSGIDQQFWRVPALHVISDSGYYKIYLQRYYNRKGEPKIGGGRIDSARLWEKENGEITFTTYGGELSETKKFNIQQLTDSLKAENNYHFTKYNLIHGKFISENRAWTEFAVAVFILLFIMWKVISVLVRSMRKEKIHGCLIAMLLSSIMFVGLLLSLGFYILIFSEVRYYFE